MNLAQLKEILLKNPNVRRAYEAEQDKARERALRRLGDPDDASRLKPWYPTSERPDENGWYEVQDGETGEVFDAYYYAEPHSRPVLGWWAQEVSYDVRPYSDAALGVLMLGAPGRDRDRWRRKT